MLVSDLKHNLLNYWVGKAQGLDVMIRGDYCWLYSKDPAGWTMYMPTVKSDIVLGVMKHAKISVNCVPTTDKLLNDNWIASIGGHCTYFCSDINIAILRCFVATKYGERVDDKIIGE